MKTGQRIRLATRMRRMALPAALSLAGLAPTIGQALAETTVRIRNHPGFGRLVFAFDDKVSFHLARDGDHVVIHFDPPDHLPDAGVPRNVLAYRRATHEAGAH